MTDHRRYRNVERRLFEDAGMEPIERRVRLRTLGTEARVLETGDGPPVVFLHGGPNAAATWSYVAAALTGLRCILVDRPGTGLSEPLSFVPNAATLPGYVVQLTVDVLDALDLPRVTLVGSSLGGYSALRSAAALPGRVDRVVLAGCPAFVPGWTAPAFFTLLRTPVVGRLLLAAPATRGLARLSLRQLGHQQSLAVGRIPHPMIDWIHAWQRDTETMRNDAAMIRAAGTWRGGFDPRLDLGPADLAAVGAPCHVVVGCDDPVGGEDVALRLRSLLRSSTLEVWPGAGHLPWLDDPARFALAVTSSVRSAPMQRAC